jgi:molecular chaperone DnaK
VYSTEKGLGEYGDKIGEEEKSQIETALNELKTALKEEEADINRIRELTQALEQASYKMAEAMYKDVGQQAAAGEAPPPGEAPDGAPGEASGSETGSTGDDVVDAEFRSSDEDGKK